MSQSYHIILCFGVFPHTVWTARRRPVNASVQQGYPESWQETLDMISEASSRCSELHAVRNGGIFFRMCIKSQPEPNSKITKGSLNPYARCYFVRRFWMTQVRLLTAAICAGRCDVSKHLCLLSFESMLRLRRVSLGFSKTEKTDCNTQKANQRSQAQRLGPTLWFYFWLEFNCISLAFSFKSLQLYFGLILF